MLLKFFIAEGIMIVAMVGTFAYQQLPPVTLTVGDTTLAVKVPEATVPVAELPTPPVPAPVAVVVPPRPGGLVFPVAGYDIDAVISVFGDKRGGNRLHEGIDIKAPKGTPVVAVTDGFVERIKAGGSGGKQVYLRDARGRLYYYAHLDDWSVEEYQAVKAGEPLGTVGDTGNARNTTPHLHFEVLTGKQKQAQDPLRFWVGA